LIIGDGRARVMTAMRDSRAMRTMERARAKYSRIWRRERKGMRRAMPTVNFGVCNGNGMPLRLE
jgi:hypothetical protein